MIPGQEGRFCGEKQERVQKVIKLLLYAVVLWLQQTFQMKLVTYKL